MQPAKPSIELLFPVAGIDVSASFEQQRNQTTPAGVNVRGFEPGTQRMKGGARPGLEKFVTPQLPSGSHLVQCLDTVVSFSTDALLDSADLAAGVDGTDDPSTGARNPGRTVRTGGSGRQPNRHAGNKTGIHFVQAHTATMGSATGAAAPPFFVTYTNQIRAGSLLLATGMVQANLGLGNVTDSLGNTWHSLFPFSASMAQLWWAVSSAAGACTVRYDLGGTLGTSATIGSVLEYSGVAASPFDGSSQNAAFLSDAVTWTTLPVTALGNKELLFGVFAGLYSPDPQGSFVPGTDQNPGNHNPFTTRVNTLMTDPQNAFTYYALRVIDFIGTSLNPSGSQEITATGTNPGINDAYEAVGASFTP